ncbi:hypothetical protein GOBAR_AA36367 [Gossypium barbadense]|uniref:Protein-S-isoprenylcysteine O-methyltransferase n=1 Tax=Gossypium barbadense TaxID=3634 RepID=A0A2P5VZS4_GOSBA|nr:hypothetical protein GOBAR_AA36367 [Gossypium barbadense]
METASVLLQSRTIPFGFNLKCNQIVSCRHFNKQFQSKGFYSHQSLKPIQNPSSFSLLPSPLHKTRTQFFSPLKCSFSDIPSSDSPNPLLKPFKNLSFDSVKSSLSELTPIKIVKWATIVSLGIAATKWTVNLAFSPFFWMYFSWSWLFWPWFVAIALAVYGLYCFRKHSIGEASIVEQLAIVTSVFAWLTLVPPAYFNGYLEVMVGHWLAAFEAPELHRIPGGWSNVGVWILIVVTLLMQYNSTLYLAKYSEKVVVPTAVVQFGPYRCVRHPVYASTMLLFATYCLALRAPLSLMFVVAVCLMYYEQKAKLEEVLMVETFGESYLEYASKVRCKFIPFVY